LTSDGSDLETFVAEREAEKASSIKKGRFVTSGFQNKIIEPTSSVSLTRDSGAEVMGSGGPRFAAAISDDSGPTCCLRSPPVLITCSLERSSEAADIAMLIWCVQAAMGLAGLRRKILQAMAPFPV
jgi:hypothetical protein